MVRPAPHRLAVIVLALLSVSPLAAKEWTEYAIGDTAERDIATPIPLDVTDLEATEAMKESAGQQVPAAMKGTRMSSKISAAM